jgi:DNA adenine methylase
MKAPFPYFGGKSSVAHIVWDALGNPDHYLEPFFGSGAVLLNRPDWQPEMTETINDADGFVCNVWRAIQFSPDETAKVCDWPVNHADLIARKARLIRDENYLLENLCKDDKWSDVELAGYWIWAASAWIGSGFTCPGQIPNLGNKGRGAHAASQKSGTYKWFDELSSRLRRVRVVCGDWSRICGGDWQGNFGTAGIFFDPPYAAKDRAHLYHKEDFDVAHDVRAWAMERGKRSNYRIVIAGYDEHDELSAHGWRKKEWKANGGYANKAKGESRGKENCKRETLWFSPHCINNEFDLFSQ